MGLEVEIVEKGALNGLDLDAVKNLSPGPADRILVTRMKDGTEVKLAEKHIIPRMKNAMGELEEDDVEFIILLCTGDFSEIDSSKILLRQDRIIKNAVNAILGKGKLGIVVPSSDQIQTAGNKWETTNLDVIFETLSPYSCTEQQIIEKADKIKNEDVDIIVLDCIGFDQKTKTIFRDITKKPVLLPRTLIGSVLREII